VAIVLNRNSNGNSPEVTVETRGIAGEPIDIVSDFYELWLSRKNLTEVSSTTTNPAESMALSSALSNKLINFDFSTENPTLDPVICRTTSLEKFRIKPTFESASTSQMTILSSDRQDTVQASVTLEYSAGLWEITYISCSNGEQPLFVGEFSFDYEGFLLKDSLSDNFDSNHWHLVFEQNNTLGHTSPLFINEQSSCVNQLDEESTCDTSTLSEAMRVLVQGEMTEVGVDVKRITVLE